MADCGNIPKRLISIAHGANGFESPSGGSINETVDFAEVRPGTRKAPCLYLRGYSLRANGTWGEFETPVVRGTNASLVFVMETSDEVGNVTVTATSMVAGAASFDLNGDPTFSQSQEFVFDSSNVDDLAPLAVS